MAHPNSFDARSELRVGDDSYEIFRLDALQSTYDVARLPYSLKILLENLLRTEGNGSVTKEDIEALATWDAGAEPSKEIAFTPARGLMQDFTGVPAVVDLAAMRDALVEEIGGVELGVVIDLHRVIDDEFDRLQRVDLRLVSAQADHPVAHGREIHDGGHAGEVLEENAGRRERDLFLRPRPDVPLREGADVVCVDEAAVLATQQVLEQDFQRVRQPGDFGEPGPLERRQAEDIDGRAARGELRPRIEGVGRGHP